MSFFSEFSSQIGSRHTVLLSKRELLGTSATICCLMGSGPYAMQCPRDSEDAALVRLLCESDPQAVELLLQCHGDRVRGYLHRRFPSLDAAETHDILVDAILKLIETFDPQRGSPGGWLVFLAHRAAIDVLRSGRTRGMPQGNLAEVSSPESSETPLDHLVYQERLQEVRAAFASLSDLERAIIEADLDAGEPACAERLAARFDTTEGSIYSARRRARKKLLARLKP